MHYIYCSKNQTSVDSFTNSAMTSNTQENVVSTKINKRLQLSIYPIHKAVKKELINNTDNHEQAIAQRSLSKQYLTKHSNNLLCQQLNKCSQ